MPSESPLLSSSVLSEAASHLAFLLSVIRCGEQLSEQEQVAVRSVIDRLRATEKRSLIVIPEDVDIIARFYGAAAAESRGASTEADFRFLEKLGIPATADCLFEMRYSPHNEESIQAIRGYKTRNPDWKKHAR